MKKYPIEKTIKKRQSIRSYEEHILTAEKKEKIKAYITELSNPFSVDVSFHFLETAKTVKDKKLGTYGVIKGAQDFIGASVFPGELCLEALGYSFEKLILYITSLGLGTCWLGGSFNRSGFAEAMNLKDGELFPVISPIGYRLDKKRTMDSLVRWMAKSDQRKGWNELFFAQDFSTPLKQNDAGAYTFPLEMLRLAPSAANKQPWRIIKDTNAYHFYKTKSKKEKTPEIDIQRVDLGIAACHFHLAALERNLPGRFQKLAVAALPKQEHTDYLFSWNMD